MVTDSQIVKTMILRIAEFFRFMADNEERRLYYVIPIRNSFPYAYQHSSIRDVATLCDILDLIHFFKEQKIALPQDFFEEVIRNTLHAYHDLYQENKFYDLPDSNIGDIGFFLLALEKCHTIFPSALPNDWKKTRDRLIQILLDRQNSDGSFNIFFDTNLKEYEKSGEAFYLPESLIGLISTIGHHSKELDNQIITQVQKAIIYCCQDKNREQGLTSDSATFYANWQFQLLYHWNQKKLIDKTTDAIAANHLIKLVNALIESRISKISFGNNVATVEVACYLEGLVHAEASLHLLKISSSTYDEWFEKEINRCLKFLYELQTETMPAIKGGFVHARDSHEARIDVAGHVVSALFLLQC